MFLELIPAMKRVFGAKRPRWFGISWLSDAAGLICQKVGCHQFDWDLVIWSMKFAARMNADSPASPQPVWVAPAALCRSCVFGEQFLRPGYALRTACQRDPNGFYGCAAWKGKNCIERNFR